MKYPTLPQVCCRCHKLKAPSEGRFIKSRHKFGRWLWRCSSCEQNTISREHRQGRESRYEKIVREALQAVFPRFGIKAEYKVEPYLFDFAVEDLRLLLEIDPHSTHASPGRKVRDWKKAKLAEEKGWTLVRLVPYPAGQLARRAVRAVRNHYEKLLPEARRRDAPVPKKPRVESVVEKLVRRWNFLFHHRFGFQPQFKPGDVEALEVFVAAYPKFFFSRVEQVFWDAWEHGNRRPTSKCANATSMQFFFDHVFEIMKELGYQKTYFRKAKSYSKLEKVPTLCPACGHCWPVCEDVIETECPKCRSSVPGPFAETQRSK